MTDLNLDDVIALCRAFQREGVKVWIDGGWGVDTLLGEQTRGHNSHHIGFGRLSRLAAELFIMERARSQQFYASRK